VKLDFEYNGMPVGYFTDSVAYPGAPGPYKYMPYRDPGHYNLQAELRRSGSARCTYVGPEGRVSIIVRGCPEYRVRSLTAFPVAKPDADDLERFMLETDSPYEHRRTSDGGIEILANGRSAVTLLVWLEEIVRALSFRGPKSHE